MAMYSIRLCDEEGRLEKLQVVKAMDMDDAISQVAEPEWVIWSAKRLNPQEWNNHLFLNQVAPIVQPRLATIAFVLLAFGWAAELWRSGKATGELWYFAMPVLLAVVGVSYLLALFRPMRTAAGRRAGFSDEDYRTSWMGFNLEMGQRPISIIFARVFLFWLFLVFLVLTPFFYRFLEFGLALSFVVTWAYAISLVCLGNRALILAQAESTSPIELA